MIENKTGFVLLGFVFFVNDTITVRSGFPPHTLNCIAKEQGKSKCTSCGIILLKSDSLDVDEPPDGGRVQGEVVTESNRSHKPDFIEPDKFKVGQKFFVVLTSHVTYELRSGGL